MPVPKTNHSSSSHIAYNLMVIMVILFVTIFIRCMNILVSASLCFTVGGKVDADADWCTLLWILDTTAFVLPILSNVKDASKSNMCCLLSEFLRKSFQLMGSAPDNRTTSFTPLPRCCRVSFSYVSQTI